MSGLATPHVLVIIPAYNESEWIEQKLQNTLALSYHPRTVVVVDDHSTDDTYERARRFSDRGVRVMKNAAAPGKNNAVVTALRAIPSDLICITDADVLAPPDTLHMLVSHFSDSKVGAACGKQGYLTRRQWAQGELRSSQLDLVDLFYHVMRVFETKVDSMVGPHGQFLLVRRNGDDWIESGIRGDDVEVGLRLRAQGLRVRYVPATQFFERLPCDRSTYYRQRYRRGQAVQEVFLRHWKTLFNPRYGLFGLVCFPLEFLLYIVQPIALLVATLTALTLMSRFVSTSSNTAASVALSTLLVVVPAVRRYFAINAVLLWGLVSLLAGKGRGDRWVRKRNFARG